MSFYHPTNRTEQLLVEALIEQACFRKPHRTMTEGYTAHIQRKRVEPGEEDTLWHLNGRYEAMLCVTGPKRDMDGNILENQEGEEGIPDLMDGAVIPIFFWLNISEGIPGHFSGDVEIWWHLEPFLWLYSPHGITDTWPSKPGTFLWKPDGYTSEEGKEG